MFEQPSQYHCAAYNRAVEVLMCQKCSLCIERHEGHVALYPQTPKLMVLALRRRKMHRFESDRAQHLFSGACGSCMCLPPNMVCMVDAQIFIKIRLASGIENAHAQLQLSLRTLNRSLGTRACPEPSEYAVFSFKGKETGEDVVVSVGDCHLYKSHLCHDQSVHISQCVRESSG